MSVTISLSGSTLIISVMVLVESLLPLPPNIQRRFRYLTETGFAPVSGNEPQPRFFSGLKMHRIKNSRQEYEDA